MKTAFQHAPAKKNGQKAPAKRATSRSTIKKQDKPVKLTAPIFNTRYAGMPYTYIRPFDPVWPTEESQN